MTNSNYGYLETTKGLDEDGRVCRVIDRADGAKHGHLHLPDGGYAAFIIEDGRAFVGVDDNRQASWEKASAKRAANRG